MKDMQKIREHYNNYIKLGNIAGQVSLSYEDFYNKYYQQTKNDNYAFYFNYLTKAEIIKMHPIIYKEYVKYYNLHLQNLNKETILMKDIINSISLIEFIKQKYFNK